MYIVRRGGGVAIVVVLQKYKNINKNKVARKIDIHPYKASLVDSGLVVRDVWGLEKEKERSKVGRMNV